MSVRDITLEDTIDIKFTTRAFATGAPTTLAGSPVISAYPGNSLTQLTAGITLTVDFDGVTGLHNIRVVATAANGYAANTDYALVITTGTVGGVSVVGEVVGEFTTSRSAAAVDLANGTDGLGAIKADTAATLLDTGTDGVVVASGSKTGYTLTATTGLGNQTANITGNLSGSVGSVTGAVGSVTGAVGSVTGAVGSVTAGVTVTTNNDKTGYTVSTVSDKTGYSLLATTGLGNQTSNITGTITTVTNLTNLPAITANWITTAGITDGAFTAAKFAAASLNGKGDWSTTTPPTAAAVADAVWDEAQADHVAVGSFGITASEIADILVDTAEIGAAGAGLTNIGTIATVTNLTNLPSIPTGWITAAGIADGAIDNATFAADVGSTAIATNVIGIAAKKGVVDALNVDTYAEPGQGAPAATTTPIAKLGYLYKAWRNKATQTATQYSLYADDTTTIDQKATFSDDATTATRGEIATGP